MIWFTADYHLSHKNIIKYSNRPYINIKGIKVSIQQRNLRSGIKM